VPMRFVSTAFLAVVALAVSECAQIVGVLLVFTLMVGPPAAAQAVTTGLWTGLALSVALALGEAWIGITLAYYTDWPVSFCIAILSAAAYFGAIATPGWRDGSQVGSIPGQQIS
jgi:zinc/manganese transport system permease protein